jgi:predicted dehydrogenase
VADKIKLAFIGAGGIARGAHMPPLQKMDDVEVVAVADVSEDAARQAADLFEGRPKVYSDYREMLKNEKLDAVDICTPNLYHRQPTIDALNAGLHVIVEKPIAMNAEEAKAMVRAARQNNRKLMVAQCQRFRSDVQLLKKMIDAGELGEIYYARVWALRRRGVPAWGVFIEKDKQGGGPMIDIGVHMLDMALYLMGHPRPVAVSGQCYTKFGNRKGVFNPWGEWDPAKYTVEDYAAGFVRFENGATLSIEASFVANNRKDELNVTLLGTEGGSDIDPFRIYKERHQRLIVEEPTLLPQVNTYEAELKEFFAAIREDRDPLVTGEQALMTQLILDGIYESSEKGREVLINA